MLLRNADTLYRVFLNPDTFTSNSGHLDIIIDNRSKHGIRKKSHEN